MFSTASTTAANSTDGNAGARGFILKSRPDVVWNPVDLTILEAGAGPWERGLLNGHRTSFENFGKTPGNQKRHNQHFGYFSLSGVELFTVLLLTFFTHTLSCKGVFVLSIFFPSYFLLLSGKTGNGKFCRLCLVLLHRSTCLEYKVTDVLCK